MIELNKKNIKKILILITYTIIICFFVFKYNKSKYIVNTFFNIISPFIYGFVIAFILNIIVKKFDSILKIKNRKRKRIISIVLTFLIIFGLIVLTLILIIPQVIDTIDIFIKKLPYFIDNIKQWIINFLDNKPKLQQIVNTYNNNIKDFIGGTTKIMKNTSKKKVINSIDDVILSLTNVFLGVIISVIMLINKEYIIKKVKIQLKSLLSKDKYNKLKNIVKISNEKFQKFFIVQFLEAIIIGIITLVLMLILKIPYSFSISIIISIMALIPVIGLIIGIFISIVLIASKSLIKAIWFILIIMFANFIEGNFIKSKIMQKNLDVPAIVIFIVLIIAGVNFGIIGLLLSIPISAIIYELCKNKLY